MKQYMELNGTCYLLQQRPIQKDDIVTWEYKGEQFVGKVEKIRKHEANVNLRPLRKYDVKIGIHLLTVLNPIPETELRRRKRDWLLQLIDLALATNDQKWFEELSGKLKRLES